MQKWSETKRYIFFGALTTIVGSSVFLGLEWVLQFRVNRSYLISEVVQFIVALSFAYVVNKLFVFEQKSWAPRVVAREIISFTVARLFSFALEIVLLLVAMEWIWPLVQPRFMLRWQNFYFIEAMPENFTAEFVYTGFVRWGIIAVIVVILNYIFAKWVVFRREEEEEEPEEELQGEEDEADIMEC